MGGGAGGGEAELLSDFLELGHPAADVRMHSIGDMKKMLPELWEGRFSAKAPDHAVYLKALTLKYFDVWNRHDEGKICGLFAPKTVVKDWQEDYGSTNTDVAKSLAMVWAAMPAIRVVVLDVYTSVTNT